MVARVIGLIATLAPTIGPTVGGYVTEALSWHWLFFINVVPGITVGFTDSSVLRNRTSVEPEAPMEVDVERDELSFYPFLYWPMAQTQPRLSQQARDKLINFLRSGGTILFDTRDARYGTLSVQGNIAPAGPGGQKLREILDGLEVPALIPTPQDHILTKAFYLLRDCPGRYTGGVLWVEQGEGRVNDGVSSVIKPFTWPYM